MARDARIEGVRETLETHVEECWCWLHVNDALSEPTVQ